MSLDKFKLNGKFLMLALDHRGSFKKLMNPDNPDSVSEQQIISLKSGIIHALEDQLTGMTLDATWGLKAYPEKTKPFLMPLEKTGYTDEKDRITEVEYTVEQIRNMDASGALLLIYFNPTIGSAGRQIETARKVMEECRRSDFPYFLEIVTYGERENLVVESVGKFVAEGIIPDVWKLQYPGSLEACQQITQAVGITPWIILTGGIGFETFKQQLGDAIRAGAKGFLAGRALWQEVCRMEGEEKQKFLLETLPERFKTISEIAYTHS